MLVDNFCHHAPTKFYNITILKTILVDNILKVIDEPTSTNNPN